MTFMPNMTASTRMMRVLQPLSWRRLPGVIGDVWNVRFQTGGGGHYLAPNPRLVVFLNCPADALSFRIADDAIWRSEVGSLYIPAGVPLCIKVAQDCELSHLDLHLDSGPLQQRLDMLGALHLASKPVLRPFSETISHLAHVLADEVCRPRRPDLVADGLVSALLAEALDVRCVSEATEMLDSGDAVFRDLQVFVTSHLGDRITVADMADVIGVSESWLTRLCRKNFDTTPLRWLMEQRLRAAKQMMTEASSSLSDIASATGFADQAHLTRNFRATFEQTPAAWRRRHAVRNETKNASLIQDRRVNSL
ncbi:MAG: AraC family transcriptional regulator [Pseudomonadota bacterium]